MRAAISPSVRGSINPCAAYCATRSRIGGASARTARRTIAGDPDDFPLEMLRGCPARIGKLCTRNVYIHTPRLARVLARAETSGRSVAFEDLGVAALFQGQDPAILTLST